MMMNSRPFGVTSQNKSQRQHSHQHPQQQQQSQKLFFFFGLRDKQIEPNAAKRTKIGAI